MNSTLKRQVGEIVGGKIILEGFGFTEKNGKVVLNEFQQ